MNHETVGNKKTTRINFVPLIHISRVSNQRFFWQHLHEVFTSQNDQKWQIRQFLLKRVLFGRKDNIWLFILQKAFPEKLLKIQFYEQCQGVRIEIGMFFFRPLVFEMQNSLMYDVT